MHLYSVSVFRNCCQWLEENFFQNNGLPYFFVQGKYTYINKEIAFEEYKNVVYLAANSENISYSKWSKMIANVNFSVSFFFNYNFMVYVSNVLFRYYKTKMLKTFGQEC